MDTGTAYDWTNWFAFLVVVVLLVGAVYYIHRHRQNKKAKPKAGESYRDHKPSPPTKER